MRQSLWLIILIINIALLYTSCEEVVPLEPTTFTDARDAELYNIQKIGNQVWMSDNLRYIDSTSWLNSANPDNNYGRLYNFEAALTACPEGWHLPSDDEWKAFEMALGMTSLEADKTDFRGTNEGTQLKSTTGWNNNGNGSNSSGFNGLPSSYYSSGAALGLGDYGYYWTSSEYSNDIFAWTRRLSYDKSSVGRNLNYKTKGFSCRCVQD